MYAASPLHARSLFLFVTGVTPGGTMRRLSTTECTYLPTYLHFTGVGLDPILFFLAVLLHSDCHRTAKHIFTGHVPQPPPLWYLRRQRGVRVAGVVDEHFLLQRELVSQVGSRRRCLWCRRGRLIGARTVPRARWQSCRAFLKDSLCIAQRDLREVGVKPWGSQFPCTGEAPGPQLSHGCPTVEPQTS